MTKTFNREEFVQYVKDLKFQDLQDAANFVNEYFEYYDTLPEDNKEEKQLAWEKYVILLAKYGHLFVSFALMVMDMREKMEEPVTNGQVN